MINIAVIGTGMLGKRHLQSIVDVFSKKAVIYAVDVNEVALQKLKEEYGNHIKCCSNICELPGIIDAVVVATNSNVRRQIVENLLSHSQVKNMILEKVLFQKEEDYYAVNELIKQYHVKTWVNCARRTWNAYRDIKNLFDSDNEMYINISGGEWGIGCNGIHMLDLIQYFTRSEDCVVDVSKLENGIVESKRKGYYEFFGTIQGNCGKCREFRISCLRNTHVPLLIEVLTENKRVIIDEAHKTIRCCMTENDWHWEEKEFLCQYQSQLTGPVINEILNTGECSLSNYSESMKLHLAYIIPLMDYFKSEGWEEGTCPIT